MDFWTNFTILEKIFIFIAIPATLLLIIQLVLQLIGIGGDNGTGQGMDAAGQGMDASGQADAASTDYNAADSGVGESTGSDFVSALGTLHIFTFQGFVAFFSISGWTGLLFLRTGIPEIMALLLAFLCGIAAMVGLAYLMRSLMKLQSDGTIRLRNALGAHGEVYLRIPAANSGKGQVSIMIQERYREFDAITYSEEPIPTGTVVRVTDIISNSILVVEKVD